MAALVSDPDIRITLIGGGRSCWPELPPPGVALGSTVARAGKIAVRASNIIHPVGTLRAC
jgi:hypothetical protein